MYFDIIGIIYATYLPNEIQPADHYLVWHAYLVK